MAKTCRLMFSDIIADGSEKNKTALTKCSGEIPCRLMFKYAVRIVTTTLQMFPY
jgi:hypothetical protein